MSALEQAQAVGQGGQIAIVAHRGASGYLPEHTLEAYAKAVELGVRGSATPRARPVDPDQVRPQPRRRFSAGGGT